MTQPFLVLLRLAQIARVLIAYGVAHLLRPHLGRWPRLGRFCSGARLDGPERLRFAFEDLGGTFLKFGQMLALQPDILPLEYCNALFKLLDRIEPFDTAEAERIFVEELGRTPEEIFDTFDRRPIATASVGQVWVAHLDGRKVAVKVQRPGIAHQFAADIRLMTAFLRLVEVTRFKYFEWLLDPMGEFIAWSREELDYRNEARYAIELRRHAADNPIQYVPWIEEHLTTRRTLVIEFLEGVTLLEVLRAREAGGDPALDARLAAAGFESETFAANLISNFLGDAFRHGIYHADLHPANLLILEDNVVGYIDFGITGLMSRYSRRHLMAMTLALARGDLETLETEYLSITSSGPGSDLEVLRSGLVRLSQDWYEHEGGRRRLRVNITHIFDQMLQLSRTAGFMPERDIVKYIRSAIAIDGLLTRFDPAFDLGHHIGLSSLRYLEWTERQEWMSADRLQDLSSAGSRWLAEGPARLGRLLDLLESGDRPSSPRDVPAHRPPPAASGAGSGDGLGGGVVPLAAAILAVAFLLHVLGRPAGIGLNLWTAQIGFLAVVTLALIYHLRPTTW